MRQLLTESVLVSVIGGAIGLVLAAWGVHLLIASAPDSIPRLQEVGVDRRVALFTVFVSFASGLLFGLAPALRASRPSLNDALKEGGRSSDGGTRGRAGRLLVISEVALSLVLLIAAGLLMHSFARLQDVAPGFDSSGLLTLRLSLPQSRYTTFQKGETFFDELFANLRRNPDVRAASAATSALPFSGTGGGRTFHIEGREEKRPEDQTEEQLRLVTDGYFAAMKIPILKGREFTGATRSVIRAWRSSTRRWRESTGRTPVRSASACRSARTIRSGTRSSASPATSSTVGSTRAIGRSCTCRIASRCSTAGRSGRCMSWCGRRRHERRRWLRSGAK